MRKESVEPEPSKRRESNDEEIMISLKTIRQENEYTTNNLPLIVIQSQDNHTNIQDKIQNEVEKNIQEPDNKE